jgi:hypothetical protein
LTVSFVADITLYKLRAYGRGDSLTFVDLHIGNQNLSAVVNQHACCAFALAGSAACHYEYIAVDVHAVVSSV